MDRPIVWPGAAPLDTDILQFGRDAMVGLGLLAEAILGQGVAARGFGCLPNGGLSVVVNPGEVYYQDFVDDTPYGSLPVENYQTIKQAICPNFADFNCPAPSASGQSISYLIQASYGDQDVEPEVLPFYDSSNPAVPYTGPNNTGQALATTRSCTATLSIVAGTPANSGSQTVPQPSAGNIGLRVVTVAYGQTAITAANISTYINGPFFSVAFDRFGQDTSATVNDVVINTYPLPPIAYPGLTVRAKVANTTTGACNLQVGGLGYASIKVNGKDPNPGALLSGQMYTFTFDGQYWALQSPPAA